MRTLMFTTAIVSMTAFGAFAQTAGTATTGQAGQTDQAAGAQQQDQMVPAFLSSNFTGKSVYALDTQSARDVRDQRMTQQQDPAVAQEQRQMRWTAGDQFAADRDAWEDVGSIDDIVMTQDGEIRGVIVDVGGFLGFMAHTVMIDMDEIYFVHEDRTGTTMGTTGTAEDIDDFSVVVTMSREQLESLPEWDEDQLQIGFERRDMGAQRGTQMQEQQQTEQPQAAGQQMQEQPADQQQAAEQPGQPGAPAQPPQGYAAVDTPPSADALIGADVVDAHGNSIGQVEDAVLAQDGAFSYLVVDVGGFLGIGQHRVALEAMDVELFHNQQDDSMRVHVPMTQEQLESLPEYQG